MSNITKKAQKFSPLVIGLMLAANAYSQSVLTNGLVAYYPFNGNANDASGHGYHATVQGAYQYLSNGTLHLVGDGQLFYSGGGYVALPNYGNLNAGFTLSIWVGGETDHGTSIMAEDYVWFDDNGNKHVAIEQHDFLVQDSIASGVVPLVITNYAAWKHLVLTYTPGNVAAYLNGVSVGNANATVTPFPAVNAAIGRHWWAGGANSSARMTMDVDDFRVYSRALSADEVALLHAIESGPRMGLVKAVKPSFSYLYPGATYQLQISTNMSTWTNYGSPFTATNMNVVYPQYFEVDNWNTLFFRVQAIEGAP